MSKRSINNVAPTANSIALNAYIYGYGGSSLVTPHAALKRLWWTEERIRATVTEGFIKSKLRPEERPMLQRPLAFGDGLTDNTYMQWILEKATRLFLVLVEIGFPDQIFAVVDAAFDDDDLPLPVEAIERLQLSSDGDKSVEARFFSAQFTYLLREPMQDSHITYGTGELIPLEYIHKLPPAACIQHWDRVHLPRKPETMYMRRKFLLTDTKSNKSNLEEFLRDVTSSRRVQHPHIAPVWASYTSKGAGYIMTPFVAQHTLRTYIDHRTPMSLLRLDREEQHAVILNWLHCLADAVAMMHYKGFCHTAIRPSNILIDANNDIAFSDIGSLKVFQSDKKREETEIYNYKAPENCISATPYIIEIPAITDFPERRASSSSRTSSSGLLSAPMSPTLFRPFTQNSISAPSVAASDDTSSSGSSNGSHLLLQDLPAKPPEKSDVYALGCVFVDILTFFLKRKASDLVKHRQSKNRKPGKLSVQVDASFHANPDNVIAWLDILNDDAFERDEQVYRAIPHLTRLTRRMLCQNPQLRPTAREVSERMHEILVQEAGLDDRLHCAHQRYDRQLQSPVVPSRSDMSSRQTRRSSASSYTRTTSMSSLATIKPLPWQRPFLRVP